MVSTAAGMAASGLIPFCNSFAMFLTGVCYMPIRTQIAYPALPVKLIGSSAGLTQGPDGASHQSLEDIALMRALPNMVVIQPADEIETRQATLAIAEWPGPVYMRLGRYPVPCVTSGGHAFEIGKARLILDGSDVTIFATGHMVCKALDAAEILAGQGVHATVVNVSTIKPLDTDSVLGHSVGAPLVVTVEEHSIIGGLGGAIAETLAETAGAPRLLRLGVRDRFGESGTADELLEKYRLSGPRLAEDILAALR
jgi:transketolase